MLWMEPPWLWASGHHLVPCHHEHVHVPKSREKRDLQGPLRKSETAGDQSQVCVLVENPPALSRTSPVALPVLSLRISGVAISVSVRLSACPCLPFPSPSVSLYFLFPSPIHSLNQLSNSFLLSPPQVFPISPRPCHPPSIPCASSPVSIPTSSLSFVSLHLFLPLPCHCPPLSSPGLTGSPSSFLPVPSALPSRLLLPSPE